MDQPLPPHEQLRCATWHWDRGGLSDWSSGPHRLRC